MITKTYQLETLTCPNCVAKIEGMMKKTKGISEGEVLFNTSRVRINFDEDILSSEDIIAKIEKLGFDVLGEK
ncbi:heavy-metal-associated domain-containing protein [Tissierella praeacuta]|uniref:heavy-metal-associated domain-containing protein n=1 Tax=Tissierella praeacuta TaxID=43131 RepID=UPI000EE46B26|nr:heavy-metal-associated domain-containing protein [Tissierella praeacuta]MBU5255972.1 heavy-metal-associated domain-containing protein [Tissierella praeacuta]TCU77410.1 heavy-metal-associated domain-containing protein [Tissierella praeacuta]HAE91421.1 heavy metal-binding protein [Tissierella sp.]